MGEDSDQNGHSAAQAMIDTFASVGATRFDVTWTTRAGDKEWFRRSMSLADLGGPVAAEPKVRFSAAGSAARASGPSASCRKPAFYKPKQVVA